MCILVLPKEEFYCSIAVCVCVCVRARVHVLCSVQSCLTLNSSRDCNPPGSSVHESLQTRILEWVAMVFSRGSSQPRDWTCVSRVSCIGRRILYHCATCVAETMLDLHYTCFPSPPGSMGKPPIPASHAVRWGRVDEFWSVRYDALPSLICQLDAENPREALRLQEMMEPFHGKSLGPGMTLWRIPTCPSPT